MNWLVIVHNLVPRALFPGFGGGAGKRKSALGRGWIVQGLWSWLSWIVTKVNHNVLYISPRRAPKWSGAKKRGLEEAWGPKFSPTRPRSATLGSIFCFAPLHLGGCSQANFKWANTFSKTRFSARCSCTRHCDVKFVILNWPVVRLVTEVLINQGSKEDSSVQLLWASKERKSNAPELS